VAALVVDVVTKAIAVGVLVPGQRVPLIGDHVSYALTRNAGAAFSLGVAYTAELAVLVGGIIGGVVGVAGMPAPAIGVGLVLGGPQAIWPIGCSARRGRCGAVVEFVAIGWCPIFNAADVCVVVGVAILTWRLLADGRGPASA
jgi:signal peptidase II